ncbi:MAG: hypothetical protein GY797_01910 [Deltaproteobacteria bacterium]|nr:hypothetical protein [Deltaproteobacteria bacterium]
MNSRPLKERLIEIGYPRLFMYEEHNLADSIWEDGKNVEQLKSIIFSASSSTHAKFLAAEVFRHFEVELNTQSYGILAEAYAYALEHTSADRENIVQLNGNLWGLLYEENDAGYLGMRFIKFGHAAIPTLIKLLNDNASRILYEGSEEATIGNAYQYRIKDFAAFYISKIKNIPIKFYQDFEKRDKEIERLKDLFREN